MAAPSNRGKPEQGKARPRSRDHVLPRAAVAWLEALSDTKTVLLDGAPVVLGPSPCPYSPECVEGLFSEVRLEGLFTKFVEEILRLSREAYAGKLNKA